MLGCEKELSKEAGDNLAVKAIDDICGWNRGAILATDNAEHPKRSFRKLRREQLTNMASYVARLVSNGIITPTVELEERLLRFADLPVGTNKKELPAK